MHKNNFDFLRLLLAIFVIITHSYSLTGLKECDILCSLSDGQTLLSYIGVRSFFIISGYLIFQSLMRSHNLIDYFWKRILRLYPALCVVLMLTIILAPLVYHHPSIPYLKNIQVWTYVPRNLSLFFAQYKIDGIFEHNPYPSIINGSLWTIHYEFAMYCIVALLWFTKEKKHIIVPLLIIIYIILLIINLFFLSKTGGYFTILNTNAMANLGLFFISGSLMAAINIGRMKYLKSITFISFVMMCHSLFFGAYFEETQYIFLPVLIIGFGLQKTKFINDLGNRIGDLSYGMYIYGFIVQQALMYYFNLNYFYLLIYSLIITTVLAYFSWHYIELKFLKLKKLNVQVLLNRKIQNI